MTDLRWEELGVTHDGTPVERIELHHGDLTAAFLTFGATLQSLRAPDRDGRLDDVVLGFDTLEGYLEQDAFIGAVVGRYANRIAHGRFVLDGQEHRVPATDRGHALHGGPDGFHRQVWARRATTSVDGPQVVFEHVSQHGHMGFPGTVEVSVTYTLTTDGLRVEYLAVADRPTLVNPTHHAYFNLAGVCGGTVERHELEILADRYLPVDETGIPIGGPAPVAGTPFDFREPRPVGARLRNGAEQLRNALGYDHSWVLDRPTSNDGLTLAARVRDPDSGRVLEVSTDRPAVHFYSGNQLDGSLLGKGGRTYRQSDGLCLETQTYPDSPNRPDFPPATLFPGQRFSSTTFFGLRAD
ncbi:aldose epimerase family protein [Nocardioides pakistanensis]